MVLIFEVLLLPFNFQFRTAQVLSGYNERGEFNIWQIIRYEGPLSFSLQVTQHNKSHFFSFFIFYNDEPFSEPTVTTIEQLQGAASYNDAKSACKNDGKRLLTVRDWEKEQQVKQHHESR